MRENGGINCAPWGTQEQSGLACRAGNQVNSCKADVEAHLEAGCIVAGDMAFQLTKALQLCSKQGCARMSIPVQGMDGDYTGLLAEAGHEADACELAAVLTPHRGNEQETPAGRADPVSAGPASCTREG